MIISVRKIGPDKSQKQFRYEPKRVHLNETLLASLMAKKKGLQCKVGGDHLRNAFSFDKKLVIFKNKAKYTLYYNSLVYNWIGGNAEVSHLQKVAFTQQYASLFHKICGIFACPKRNSLLLKTEQFEVCLGKDAINWRKFWKIFNGNFCFQSLNLS